VETESNSKFDVMRKTTNILVLSIFMLVIANYIMAQSADSLKRVKATELMKLAQQEYEKIRDYQATIITNEMKGDHARKTEYILARYMQRNYIYLKWLPGPYEGMQASYIPSRDKPECFLAKETGLLGLIGTKTWTNGDPLIDKLYPHNFTIHQTSLAYFFETMQAIVKKGTEMNKLTVVSVDEVIDKYTHQPATSVIVTLSKNPNDGLMWSKVQLYFDKKDKLPLHFILYDFAGKKTGEYAFINFKKNIGLTKNDFEIE
jgi:outer membrane lipoprotein-sorting protein